MKKTKTQKGITLIALIITIVLLLIIAVVAIGAVRESGIIAHTQNAATSYKEEQAKENTAIQGYEGLIDKYANPISVEDLYWYEENSEGGITILGPKKVLYLDSDKVWEKVAEIIDTEYGAGTFDAIMNETIEDEELFNEIAYKGEFEYAKIQYDFSNNECWIVRDITREEVGGGDESFGNNGESRIYSTEKLPDYIDGKPVTKIADYAFSYVYVINGEFIPNTVTHIGVEAFSRSLFESKLIIPDSVKEIQTQAFYGLIAIPDFENQIDGQITLIMNDAENNLISIGREAFAHKSSNPLIGTLNLRSEIEIADNAFEYSNVTVNRK